MTFSPGKSDFETCTECNTRVTIGYINHHIRRKHVDTLGKKKYRCIPCDFPFARASEWNDHADSLVHAEHVKSTYSLTASPMGWVGRMCEECQCPVEEHDVHVREKHMVETGAQLFCGVCDRTLASKGLWAHLVTELHRLNAEKLGFYWTALCGAEKTRAKLGDVCIMCDLSVVDVNQHIIDHHTVKFFCSLCEYQAVSAYGLRTHMKMQTHVDVVAERCGLQLVPEAHRLTVEWLAGTCLACDPPVALTAEQVVSHIRSVHIKAESGQMSGYCFICQRATGQITQHLNQKFHIKSVVSTCGLAVSEDTRQHLVRPTTGEPKWVKAIAWDDGHCRLCDKDIRGPDVQHHIRNAHAEYGHRGACLLCPPDTDLQPRIAEHLVSPAHLAVVEEKLGFRRAEKASRPRSEEPKEPRSKHSKRAQRSKKAAQALTPDPVTPEQPEHTPEQIQSPLVPNTSAATHSLYQTISSAVPAAVPWATTVIDPRRH